MPEMDYSKSSPFSYSEGLWLASDPEPNDLAVGETTIRRLEVASSAVVISSGNIRLTHFTATKTETISQVSVVSGNTAAAATPTKIQLCVYSVADNGDMSLVASTPNDTTLFAAANTLYTKAFSASFMKLKGQRYAFGVFIETAVATPTFLGAISYSQLTPVEPKLASFIGSQSAIPSSISNGSLLVSSQITYAALLP